MVLSSITDSLLEKMDTTVLKMRGGEGKRS